MPYIITTTRPPRNEYESEIERCRQIESVCAVATLDEARRAVWRILPDPTSDRLKHAANGLSESGDTIGPLPDGTVIEVKTIDWERMP